MSPDKLGRCARRMAGMRFSGIRLAWAQPARGLRVPYTSLLPGARVHRFSRGAFPKSQSPSSYPHGRTFFPDVLCAVDCRDHRLPAGVASGLGRRSGVHAWTPDRSADRAGWSGVGGDGERQAPVADCAGDVDFRPITVGQAEMVADLRGVTTVLAQRLSRDEKASAERVARSPPAPKVPQARGTAAASRF
jgi:hypothetical protein